MEANTEGETTVVLPGRKYHALARNQLFGQTFASIAVAGESLLIRNSSALMRIATDD